MKEDLSQFTKRLKTSIKPEMTLKMYMFLVRPNDSRYPFFERVEICFAYQLEAAFDLMQDIYKDELEGYFIKNVGVVEASKILNSIEPSEQKVTMKFQIAEEKEDYDPKMSYLCSLKYTADAFNKILNKTDKSALARIIKKIDKNLAYDAKCNPKK